MERLTPRDREILFRRSGEDISSVRDSVAQILAEVKNRGDEALREFTLRFDKVDLKDLPLEVTAEEYRAAEESLDPALKEALDYCIENTKKLHEQQKPEAMSFTELRPGLFAGERPAPSGPWDSTCPGAGEVFPPCSI